MNYHPGPRGGITAGSQRRSKGNGRRSDRPHRAGDGRRGGIGAATAKALAEAGAKVVISDIGDGNALADAIGGAYVRHDVTSEDDWIAAVAFAKATFGGLDILVNNAGIFLMKPIAETTLEDFRRMQQVNVEGVFLGPEARHPRHRRTRRAMGRRRRDRQSVVGRRHRRPAQHPRLQRLEGRGAADDEVGGAWSAPQAA